MDRPRSHRRPRPSHPLLKLGRFPPCRVRRHVGTTMAQSLHSGRDARIRYRSQSASAAQDERYGHTTLRLRHGMFAPHASSHPPLRLRVLRPLHHQQSRRWCSDRFHRIRSPFLLAHCFRCYPILQLPLPNLCLPHPSFLDSFR